MKTKWIWLVLIIILTVQNGLAEHRFDTRSSGISIRCGMWGAGEIHTTSVAVSARDADTRVETGKYGGWLSFYNRIAPEWMLTLSLGGSGRADVKSSAWSGNEMGFEGHSGMLVGMQFYPLTRVTVGSLKPYLSFEAGPYWLTRCQVEENIWGVSTVVETTTLLKPGLAAGGGMHYLMSNWFGLEMNLKYHAVNLDFDHPESGWEFGIGAAFFWGTFDPE